MLTIGTFETWSYIHAQLDFKRRVRVHIINGSKTLCGLAVSSGWESADYSREKFLSGWPCGNCQRADTKRRYTQRTGTGENGLNPDN